MNFVAGGNGGVASDEGVDGGFINNYVSVVDKVLAPPGLFGVAFGSIRNTNSRTNTRHDQDNRPRLHMSHSRLFGGERAKR